MVHATVGKLCRLPPQMEEQAYHSRLLVDDNAQGSSPPDGVILAARAPSVAT